MTPAEKQTQVAAALAKGNALRSSRKLLREGVNDGYISLADVIREVPPEVQKMSAVKLLQWEPGIGPYRAKTIVRSVTGIFDLHITMRQLAPSRRDAMVAALVECSPGSRWRNPRFAER